MSTATTRRRAAPAEPSTPEQLAASILALVQAVERHGPDAPAAIAFRSALTRKGREIAAAGGPATLASFHTDAEGRRIADRVAVSVLRALRHAEWTLPESVA